MPLFKFASTGTPITVFSATLEGHFPALVGEFERTGYVFEAELSPEVPRIYLTFGFEAHLSPPLPSVAIAMQDMFSAALNAPVGYCDGTVVSINEFTGELTAPFPVVRLSQAFSGDLSPRCVKCLGLFVSEGYFEGNLTCYRAQVSGSFAGQVVFSAALSPELSDAYGEFTVGEGIFSADLDSFLPQVSGRFSGITPYSFGSETDAVLRHESSRRYI